MSNKLPEKKILKIEEDKTKKSSPTAPIIETPVPPQVMDPSVIPASEKKKSFIMPGKRSKKYSKGSRQAR